MDECLQKLALCYTRFRVSGPGLFCVLSLAYLLTNVLSTGGGVSVEVAGCGFPDGFGNGLVVTHGRQAHIFGYHIKSLSAILTEPEGLHMLSMLSQWQKIKVIVPNYAFDILSRN